ncbi:MAG: Tfx family DNA-binding protein [Methanothrix sp.]
MIFEEEGEGEEGDKGAEKMDDSARTDTEAEGASYSFLTKRQLEVLQMRHQGLSQQDVADRLGTTRSNISILEKRAHQNIARAQRTVQQWMMIRAPISVIVKGGTDVFEIPRMIFAAADEMGIRLHVTSMDILVQLRRNAPLLFHKRVLERDVRIYMKENGEAMVEVVE